MDLKKFLFSLTAVTICLLCSCTSSDDEQDNIVFPLDQPTTVNVAANQNSDQIRFTAMDSWSAYTSSQSRDVNDVDWIHLTDTHGAAGEAYLNFTLDYNNTGESRTAYIIIVSGDTRIVVTIIQSAENNPDVPNPIAEGMIEIEVKDYYDDNSGHGFEWVGTDNYTLYYSNDFPVKMTSTWRDDLDSYPGAPADHDSYCLNTETTSFNWDGNDRNDVKSVAVNMETRVTYYPSERTELEDISEHYAEIKNGRAVSGWYQWPREDLNRSEWNASFDSNGFLSNTKNNDASPIWDTYTMTWTDGNLTKIVSEKERGTISITYAEPSLLNMHQTFDLNWVLPKELECYDFAAGDITRIFASIGFMGKTSKNLLTYIEEYDGSTTRSYRMNYIKNTKDVTIVTVMHFVDGVQTSYSEWTIKYINIK